MNRKSVLVSVKEQHRVEFMFKQCSYEPFEIPKALQMGKGMVRALSSPH